MGQCAVSLNLADQFEYSENPGREVICDPSTNENSKYHFMQMFE